MSVLLFRNHWIKENNDKKALHSGLSSTIENILSKRVSSEEEAKAFLCPLLKEGKLPDEDKAIERILRAIRKKEHITVLGDYDVDGMTSTALLYSFFKDKEVTVDYIIPSRYEHGYGLNPKSVSLIGETDLLLTVDCGIASIQEVESLKDKMDVIITDHHEPKEEMPNALAVLNPKLSQEVYHHLAGVGVTFRLVRALCRELKEELTDDYYVLAMLGTICDVMPLLHDNRFIVKEGLKRIADTSLTGLKALLEELNINPHSIESEDVAFRIGPTLNATGRLGEEQLALKILTTSDSIEVIKLAKELVALNSKRKEIQVKMADEAKSLLNHKDAFHVVKTDHWLEGMLGIVSSKLAEEFRKPVILLNESETLKGSGRSIGRFNLLASLDHSATYLMRYGGHQAACGVELKKEDLDSFKETICSYTEEHLRDEDKLEELYYQPLELGDISMRRLDELDSLKPFGVANEEPLFGLEKLKLVQVDLLGKNKRTHRLHFLKDNRRIEVMHFSKPLINLIVGEEYDILFTMHKNIFQGIARLQLFLKDIRFSSRRLDRFSPAMENEIKRYLSILSDKKDHREGYLTIEKAYEDKAESEKLIQGYPDVRILKENKEELTFFFNHIPTREDLVFLYKHVKSEEGHIEADETKFSFLKLLLSLKILEEIGIITYTRNRFSFKVNLINHNKTFDLMDSIIYRQALKLKEEFNELKK